MLGLFILSPKGEPEDILSAHCLAREDETIATKFLIGQEKEFVERAREEDFFKELLKRLDMTEQQWIDNAVKATISLSKKKELCERCDKLMNCFYEKIVGLCFKCLRTQEKLHKNIKGPA